MLKLLSIIFACFLLSTASLQSQETVKTFDISKAVTNGSVDGLKLVWNSSRNEWLATWKKEVNPGVFEIYARTVTSNGQLGATKVIGNGMNPIDIAYNPATHSYLFIVKTPDRLSIQTIDEDLNNRGTSALIDLESQNGNGQLLYDPATNRFLLLWIADDDESIVDDDDGEDFGFAPQDGYMDDAIKAMILSATGVPLAAPKIVQRAQVSYHEFLAERNPLNGNIFVLDSENTLDKLLVFAFQSNDSLSSSAARTIASTSGPNLSPSPDISFSISGNGLAIWSLVSGEHKIFIRKVSAAGIPIGKPSIVATESSYFGVETILLFDSRHNQFLAFWPTAAEIHGTKLNQATAAPAGERFSIARVKTGTAHPVSLNGSYDANTGNALIAWVEKANDNEIVRGTILKP